MTSWKKLRWFFPFASYSFCFWCSCGANFEAASISPDPAFPIDAGAEGGSGEVRASSNDAAFGDSLPFNPEGEAGAASFEEASCSDVWEEECFRYWQDGGMGPCAGRCGMCTRVGVILCLK
jgi:hypothetical protein